jgi:predicted O-methyltransferase YrrM
VNSLDDKDVCRCLERLRAQAGGDSERWAQRQARKAAERAAGVAPAPDSLVRMGDMYLAISDSDGRLLYSLARAIGAKRIIEFGASFGISSIYLAAAARDNRGSLITTEVHPDKCASARDNLASAGLESHAVVLEGDALITLTDVEAPIDFLFLDGWKGLYAPLLEMLKPKLAPRALVAADNISHAAAEPYRALLRAAGSGFVSNTVGDLELSVLGNSVPTD